MLKIAICEDNPIHARLLEDSVRSALDYECEITVFEASLKFLNSIQQTGTRYDIVLLDIQLDSSKTNGISLAQDINRQSPDTQVIFISQYLEYASSVYETKHVYFINKEQMDLYLPKALGAAVENLKKAKQRFLYFSQKKQKIRVKQSDILYMERILRSTSIHTRIQPEPYTTPENLQALLERLSSAFILCHRSFLVNLRAVSTFSREQITLLDGQSVPMGRTHYESFKKAFAKITFEI